MATRKRLKASDEEAMGHYYFGKHNVSQSAENLIKVIADVDESGSSISNALDPSYLFTNQLTPTYNVPSRVLAQMKVSEYFLKTESDLFQTVEVGIDLGLKRILIQHADSGVVNEYEQLFEELKLHQLAQEIYWCLELFGQAYPAEVWDGEKDHIPLNVNLMDPKNIVVDRMASFSRPVFRLAPSAMAISQEIHQEKVPKEIQYLFLEDIVDTPNGASMTFRPGSITQIRSKEPRFYPYCTPPFTPIFRDLSTRQVLEEMIRATIEGVKNQLWVFKLADPAPGELTKLSSVISGTSGERTGYLVWKANLSVEQHVPKSIDALLANETWMRLTRAILRGRGVSLKVLDGESPDRNITSDIDVQIFLQRIKFYLGRIQDYLQGFAMKYAERNQPAGRKKVLTPPKIDFERNDLETAMAIKDRVIPLWRSGLSSPQTALKDSGLNYDNELRQKHEASSHLSLFVPLPTFSQTTVKPETPERTSMADPYNGRPSKDGNQKVKGHTLWSSLDEYQAKIEEAVSILKATFLESKEQSVSDFANSLKELNYQYMARAYESGYLDAGGQEETDQGRIEAVVMWNNGYVDNFIWSLMVKESPEGIEGRANLYAHEGQKMAYVYGLFQARREQGYTGWRRLAGEKSCSQCRADGMKVHPISEEFFDFHPGGGCQNDFVSFYRGETSSLPLILPALPGVPLNPDGSVAFPIVERKIA